MCGGRTSSAYGIRASWSIAMAAVEFMYTREAAYYAWHVLPPILKFG